MNATPQSKTIQPQPSFLNALRAFHRNLLERATTVAEIKAAIYVFDNTVVFQEFNQAKKITLDEFQHGRRRRDRSRMDKGCGIVSRSSIVAGLRLAEQHGILSSQKDASDAARIEKRYAPCLPHLTESSARQPLQLVTSNPADQELGEGARGLAGEPPEVSTPDSRGAERRPPEVPARDLSSPAARPRSEKVLRENTKEKIPQERSSPPLASREVQPEARKPVRVRSFHELLDQIELPCFQEQRGVEEEEAEEASEEATGREADSQKQELRATLEMLTRECNQAYCRMASSAWGTRERDESKQRLLRLRGEQQQVRRLLDQLEAE